MSQNLSFGVVPGFLLDPALDPVFDGFTRLAAKVLRVPVALVSILNTERQFFKSHCGLSPEMAENRGTPVSRSFCRHVVAFAEDLVVDDTLAHPLVKDNPLIHEMGVRAYLGSPIFNADGKAIGAFCVTDTVPHIWTTNDRELVRALAAQVTNEVVFRTLLENRGTGSGGRKTTKAEGAANGAADIRDLRTSLRTALTSLQALEAAGPMSGDQTRFLRVAEKNILLVLSEMDQAGQQAASGAGVPA